MSAPKVIKRTPDLGLKIRLQPVADAGPAAAPGGCPCNATGVVWLVRPTYVYEASEWGDYADWYFPSLSTSEAVGVTEWGSLVYGEENPRPDTFIRTGAPYYYEGEPASQAVVFVAAPVGPEVRGIQWSVDRVGSEAFSIEIDISGPFASVTLNPAVLDDLLPGFTTLTLTARCGDAVVGELQLQVTHEGF